MEQILTTEIPSPLYNKMTKAKVRVMVENSFYATLLCSAHVWYTNNPRIPTMGTDGRDYFVNIDFVAGLSDADILFILKHEIIHKALLHPTRCQDRNKALWNIAIDIVTNGILVEEGGTLPKGGVYDEALKDLPSEEIYRILIDEPDREVAGRTGKDWRKSGAAPNHLISGPTTPGEVRALEAEVMIQNAQALAELNREAGSTSNCAIKKYLQKMLEPKVDWKAKLREFVSSKGSDDWTFSKPAKNYMAHGFYMPSTTGTDIGRILIAVDTSGSIFSHQSLVDQFSAEINSICEDTTPECLDVIYMDTEVRGHDTFEQGEEFIIDLKGGGGTAFKTTFDYIRELENPPVAVIVFTDMYVFDLDKCECEIPTLWMQYGCHKEAVVEPPFGVVTAVVA